MARFLPALWSGRQNQVPEARCRRTIADFRSSVMEGRMARYGAKLHGHKLLDLKLVDEAGVHVRCKTRGRMAWGLSTFSHTQKLEDVGPASIKITEDFKWHPNDVGHKSVVTCVYHVDGEGDKLRAVIQHWEYNMRGLPRLVREGAENYMRSQFPSKHVKVLEHFVDEVVQ